MGRSSIRLQGLAPGPDGDVMPRLRAVRRAGALLDAPRARRAAPGRLGLLRPTGRDAAIKRDEHPATYTYANIETQAESFRRYAISFDWSRRLHTSDPDYLSLQFPSARVSPQSLRPFPSRQRRIAVGRAGMALT